MAMGHRRVPEGLLYDRNHYWVKVAGREASIGLSAHGQHTIGDILYLELVSPGAMIRKGEGFGSIESSKWVGALIAPVTGVVLDTNREVEASPGQINVDPYGQGWILRIELSDIDELKLLMKATAYRQWVEEQINREHQEEGAI